MFEKYTEKARRVIFFARYEASQFGQTMIDTPCLLLGILREDKQLANRVLGNHAAFDHIRKSITALYPPTDEKIATSVDLPLSRGSKRALAYAAEEAELLGHDHIGTRHLLLGLLRQNGPEVAFLNAYGVDLEKVRAMPTDPLAGQTPVEVRDFGRPEFAFVRWLRDMPEDRKKAALTLLRGLRSGKFEATGTTCDGPFHFSFEDESP